MMAQIFSTAQGMSLRDGAHIRRQSAINLAVKNRVILKTKLKLIFLAKKTVCSYQVLLFYTVARNGNPSLAALQTKIELQSCLSAVAINVGCIHASMY
jgi:hypothetical protein